MSAVRGAVVPLSAQNSTYVAGTCWLRSDRLLHTWSMKCERSLFPGRQVARALASFVVRVVVCRARRARGNKFSRASAGEGEHDGVYPRPLLRLLAVFWFYTCVKNLISMYMTLKKCYYYLRMNDVRLEFINHVCTNNFNIVSIEGKVGCYLTNLLIWRAMRQVIQTIGGKITCFIYDTYYKTFCVVRNFIVHWMDIFRPYVTI